MWRWIRFCLTSKAVLESSSDQDVRLGGWSEATVLIVTGLPTATLTLLLGDIEASVVRCTASVPTGWGHVRDLAACRAVSGGAGFRMAQDVARLATLRAFQRTGALTGRSTERCVDSYG